MISKIIAKYIILLFFTLLNVEFKALSKTDKINSNNEQYTKYEVSLNFLKAFIYLDRNMALKYATEKAVSKLNWKSQHGNNIPYYDDKMNLYFKGGFAKLFFRKIDNKNFIDDMKVYYFKKK